MNLAYMKPKDEIRTRTFQREVVRIPEQVMTMDLEENRQLVLVKQYLALRKRIFTEQKKWQVWLPSDNDLDQYDQSYAHYVVACDERSGNVVGGARLIRTDQGGTAPGHNQTTYMIRDAYRGMLKGLPKDLCDAEPPCHPLIWELTRFVTDGSRGVGKVVLQTANDFLADQSAMACLFLGPVGFRKMSQMMGYTTHPLGQVQSNVDGEFQSFICNVL